MFGERCPQLTFASGVTLVRSAAGGDGFTSLRLLCTPVPDTTLEATAYAGTQEILCGYASWQIVWV